MEALTKRRAKNDMANSPTDQQNIAEVISPRIRAEWKKRFARLSRAQLQEVSTELALAYQRRATDREREAAEAHCDPTLVARVMRTQGRSRKLQTIYCSSTRCEDCPHGPYWYTYRSSRRKGTTTVQFTGYSFLDEATVVQMHRDVEEATPVAYEIKLAPAKVVLLNRRGV
jgi:hypothetical protein